MTAIGRPQKNSDTANRRERHAPGQARRGEGTGHALQADGGVEPADPGVAQAEQPSDVTTIR
jgi:hypothetical protein